MISSSSQAVSTRAGEPRSDRPTSGGSPFARLLVGLVRLYQLVRAGHPSPCRFSPTCSDFAVEAIVRHGPRRGLMLTARRLGRCRPGGPFGADPVPD